MSQGHNSESLQLLTIHYNAMKNVLFFYGRRFTNDHQLIENCIHDVFLNLCEKESLSSISNINFYLLRSFRNRLSEELSRKPLVEYICEISSEDMIEISVEDYFIEAERAKRIQTYLSQVLGYLTPRQKELILLYYVEQRSYVEICQLTGISYQTAKNTINQALRRLQKNVLSSLL